MLAYLDFIKSNVYFNGTEELFYVLHNVLIKDVLLKKPIISKVVWTLEAWKVGYENEHDTLWSKHYKWWTPNWILENN